MSLLCKLTIKDAIHLALENMTMKYETLMMSFKPRMYHQALKY